MGGKNKNKKKGKKAKATTNLQQQIVENRLQKESTTNEDPVLLSSTKSYSIPTASSTVSTQSIDSNLNTYSQTNVPPMDSTHLPSIPYLTDFQSQTARTMPYNPHPQQRQFNHQQLTTQQTTTTCHTSASMQRHTFPEILAQNYHQTTTTTTTTTTSFNTQTRLNMNYAYQQNYQPPLYHQPIEKHPDNLTLPANNQYSTYNHATAAAELALKAKQPHLTADEAKAYAAVAAQAMQRQCQDRVPIDQLTATITTAPLPPVSQAANPLEGRDPSTITSGENLKMRKQEIIDEYNRKVNLLNYKKVILLDKYEQKLDILIKKKRELLTKLVCLHHEKDQDSDLIDTILFAAVAGYLPNYELCDFQNFEESFRAVLQNNLAAIDQKENRKTWIKSRLSSLSPEEYFRIVELNQKLKDISSDELRSIILPKEKRDENRSDSVGQKASENDSTESAPGTPNGDNTEVDDLAQIVEKVVLQNVETPALVKDLD